MLLAAAATTYSGIKPVLKPGAPVPATLNPATNTPAPTYGGAPKDGLPSTAERRAESGIGVAGNGAGNFAITGNTLIFAVVGIAAIVLLFSEGRK